jgi:hypothetical protein
MSLKYINQSLVKSSEKDSFCPKAYLETELLNNCKKKPSLAMMLGQYFEYLATGAKNREGEIVEIPLTKRRQPSTAQLRVEWQAKQFKENLIKHDIEILTVGETLSFNLFKEFLTTGIEDTTVLYKGRPYIMDIKLTSNIDNDYGDFCWGEVHKMDKIQAYNYVLLKYHITGIKFGFIYYVADYKKNPTYKIIEVENPLDNFQEVYRRFKQAFMRMTAFKNLGYPAIPSENCEKCPVKSCQFNGKKQVLKKQIIEEKTIELEMRKIAQGNKIQEAKSKFAAYQKEKAKSLSNDYKIIYE